MHVFRWDLDKTYLETDFHSVRSLLRHAVEPASQKVNVPGSAALLRGLTEHDPTAQVWIVSGSPRQMRPKLEEKLALDGVEFHSLVLKDNLRNLRKGRLRDVFGQVGYKLPTLLRQRHLVDGPITETLFGDDAEVDAVIYSLYADLMEGRATADDVVSVMEEGGAYRDSIDKALHLLEGLPIGTGGVEDIFIRLERGEIPVHRFRSLGPRVIPVWSWLQAAVVLWERGRLGAAGVTHVARVCMEADELSDDAVASLLQDLVRRHRLPSERAVTIAEAALQPLAPRVRSALERLGPTPPPRPTGTPDYLGFLRAIE